MIEAVVPALAGAFCFATAAALQQREAVQATTSGTVNPWLVWQLAHRPLWLAGIGAEVLGVALHMFALTRGPLTLVQPLGVTALIFAVPIAAALRHHRLRLWELAAALVVLVGLGALLGVLPAGAGSARMGPGAVAGLLLPFVVLTTTATVVARLVAGRARSLLLAIGTGVALGTTSALVRVVFELSGSGGDEVPMVLACAGIAVVAPVGFLLMQSAYRAGSFAMVLATITVLDPLTAATGGVLLLHEPLPAAPAVIAAMAVGAALITLGIAALSRSSAHEPMRSRAGAPMAGGTLVAADRAAGWPRVLIGADTYPPDVNGAARFTGELARGLAALGYDVHVVCPSVHGSAGTYRAEGVTVHRLRSVRTPFHPTFRVCLPPTAAIGARRVLQAVRPDIVHVQSHFMIGRRLLRCGRRSGVPSIATNHFMPDNLVTYVHVPDAARRAVCTAAWRDCVRTFNRADIVTTPTPIAADLIRGKGLRPPVRPISCGIDLRRFRPTRAPWCTGDAAGTPGQPTLLFVGRLDEEKHLNEIIAALPEIRRHVDARLILVGTGTQRRRLAALAGRLGVTENVQFSGFVPDDELPSVYRSADVFCMPGVAELQSLVTLEAMASGLPVIAADAMALPHLVRPGCNGYLYRPGDVAELAGHAVRLLSSSHLRRRMGVTGQELASAHDRDNMLSEYEALYANLRSPADQPLRTSA